MKQKTLEQLNKEGGLFLTDKGVRHSYFSIYEELFSPLRDKEINIFEVGCQYGGSCRLWEKYFSRAHIRSIDIKTKGTKEEIGAAGVYGIKTNIVTGDRVYMEIRNVMDIDTDYFKDFPLDIAIDDGSHVIEEQIHFFNVVYPILKSGGLMIIEDVQDIDHTKIEFDKLCVPYELIDQRKERGIYDEVLLIFRKL